MSKELIFADVPIGRDFIAPSGVRYKRISKVNAKAITDSNNITIVDGKTTVKFYKTNILLQFYTG